MNNLIKKQLDKDGFYLFKNFLKKKDVDNLKIKMVKVMEQFVKVNKNLNIDDQLDQAFKKSCKVGTKLRSNIYKAISNLQEIYILTSNKKITKIISSLGIISPRNQGTSLFAVEPNISKFLTEIHQDIRNNFCSLRAINFWIPLNSVDKTSGGLGIYAGTHKLGPSKHVIDKKSGYITVKKKNILNKYKLIEINKFNKGDILAFSPFCWHFSLKNFSKKIRWTAAVCFDDAAKTEHFRKKFNPYDRSKYVTLKSNEELLKIRSKA